MVQGQTHCLQIKLICSAGTVTCSSGQVASCHQQCCCDLSRSDLSCVLVLNNVKCACCNEQQLERNRPPTCKGLVQAGALAEDLAGWVKLRQVC